MSTRTWRVRKELPDGMFTSAEFTFETPITRNTVLNCAQVKRWLGADILSEAYIVNRSDQTSIIPELLDALQIAREYVERVDSDISRDNLAQIDAAIAKATETPKNAL